MSTHGSPLEVQRLVAWLWMELKVAQRLIAVTEAASQAAMAAVQIATQVQQ